MDDEDEGRSSSSSRAVLAALRALQEKIRRLEVERAQALEESQACKRQVEELEAERPREKNEDSSSSDVLRAAYNRLATEQAELERRVAAAETAASESEARYRESEARRLATERADRSASESLARSIELAAWADARPPDEDLGKKNKVLESRLENLESVLEAMIAMNKLLVDDFRAATTGDVSSTSEPRRSEGDILDNARSALAATKAAIDDARARKPPRRVPEPAAPAPKRGRRRARKKAATHATVRRPKQAPDIPWVPSSTNDSVSYNLLAACNYALRKAAARAKSHHHAHHHAPP